MSQFKVDDRVKVDSFEGVITSLSGVRAGLIIRDDKGYSHEIFVFSESVPVVTLVEPPRPDGQIIRDADGDVFIWEHSVDAEKPWRVVYRTDTAGYWTAKPGSRHEEDMPNGPLTVLSGE